MINSYYNTLSTSETCTSHLTKVADHRIHNMLTNLTFMLQ